METSYKEHIYRVATQEEIEAANKRFNEELDLQIEGKLEAGHIYDLGYPGEILQAAGFPDKRIELSATHLSDKKSQENHPFELYDIKDLVQALNNPLAVFVYGSKSKAQNVIIEQERNGENFLVGVHFNQLHDITLVNSIRGLFPKDNVKWLNWISQGKLLFVNKEKIQNIIDKQQTSPADVAYLDLDFVAKVVQNFENPKFFEEKISTEQENNQIIASSKVNYLENAYPGLVQALRERASSPTARVFTPEQLKIIKDARDRRIVTPKENKRFFSWVWDTLKEGELLEKIPEAWVKDAKEEVDELCDGKERGNIDKLIRR